MLKPANKKKPAKVELMPIGNEELGYFYLAKYGYIKVGERNELSELEALRQEATFSLDLLLSVISKDKNISRKEASDLVFGGTDSEGKAIAPIPLADLYGQYPKETAKFTQQSNNQKIKSIVATLLLKGYYAETAKGVKFIPGRSAKPIQLLKATSPGDKTITVNPNSCHIYTDQTIKFNKSIVTVEDNYLPLNLNDDELLLKVKEVTRAIESGVIGFLYSKTTDSYILGDEDWTELDTYDLDPKMLDLIYEFYEKEQNGWEQESVGELLTLPSTEETITSSQLTGGKSTGESKDLELPTIALQVGSAS